MRFFNQLTKRWQSYLRETKGAKRKGALILLSEIVTDGSIPLLDDDVQFAYEHGRRDPRFMNELDLMYDRVQADPALRDAEDVYDELENLYADHGKPKRQSNVFLK